MWRASSRCDFVPASKRIVNHRTRVEELAARFGSDEALGVAYDEESGVSLLPDGGRASSCADCAFFIQSREPNTVIYGFWSSENIGWAGAALLDGHDFAVVDGRYVVDPWIMETEHLSNRAVFDLENPTDQLEVRRLYGDRKYWHVVEVPVQRCPTH